MTETQLFINHMRRGGDLCTDQELARWALARHVRGRGNRFFHLSTETRP